MAEPRDKAIHRRIAYVRRWYLPVPRSAGAHLRCNSAPSARSTGTNRSFPCPQNDFVTAFQNFSNGLNELGLSDTEIGLFSALVLLSSNRQGISEPKQISRVKERVAEALRVQILRSRPNSPTSIQIMPALEAKVPEIRALGARHCAHLHWLRGNWTSMRLPPLFAEIFDIPKYDDDE